jgi:hypothetical protein
MTMITDPIINGAGGQQSMLRLPARTFLTTPDFRGLQRAGTDIERAPRSAKYPIVELGNEMRRQESLEGLAFGILGAAAVALGWFFLMVL